MNQRFDCSEIVWTAEAHDRGLAVNFPDVRLRRRDPNAMVIGDCLPTDKPTYQDRFGESFDKTRQKTLAWLEGQELIVVPFYAGPADLRYGSLLICPRNCGFFAAATADLACPSPRRRVGLDRWQ